MTPRQKQQHGLKRHIPLVYLLSWAASGITLVQGETTTILECETGWGGMIHQVPSDRVNDGYCDCPLTGEDEPETEACSGMDAWSGLTVKDKATKSDRNDNGLVYSCREQPKKIIPLSQMNDGICDCCAGTDEYYTMHCRDICDVVLAEEREQVRRLQDGYEKGAKKRMDALIAYQVHQKDTNEKLEKKRADIFFIEKELDSANELVKKFKRTAIYDRKELTLMRSLGVATRLPTPAIVDEQMKGLLEGFTDDELMSLLIHACQIAGELDEMNDEHFSNNSKYKGSTGTCIPFRMAGLDSWMYWEQSTYKLRVVKEDDNLDDDGLATLSSIYMHNLYNDEKIWNEHGLASVTSGSKNRKKKKNRRRLSEDYDDDDDLPMYDDYYDEKMMGDDYYGGGNDDDYVEEEETRRKPSSRRNRKPSRPTRQPSLSRAKQSNDGIASDRKEMLWEKVKMHPFSQARVMFLEKSDDLINRIDEALDKHEEEEEGDDNDGDEGGEKSSAGENNEEKKDEQEDTNEVSFDPMALPMVKNTLEKRQKIIQRGFDYAVSAHVLIESFKEEFAEESSLRFRLYPLVMGTFNHGNISSMHFWQLLRTIVPELAAPPQEEGTCKAPWAEICPPVATLDRTLDDRVAKVPPMAITKAVEKHCEREMSQAPDPGVCSTTTDDAVGSLPSNIPDGYFGYYLLTPRTETDIFYSLFADLGFETKEAFNKEWNSLTDTKEKLEKDQDDSQEEIDNLEDSLGGKDSNKFGPNSELFSIKDECFSIEANKYTYELCMFKSAKQKEEDGGGRGTDLGKWSGVEIDDRTGARTWTWTNGAKCWNGPKRSAHVSVTCGKDNILFSADEPETCKYVFEMESYIACDEAFRIANGL